MFELRYYELFPMECCINYQILERIQGMQLFILSSDSYGHY